MATVQISTDKGVKPETRSAEPILASSLIDTSDLETIFQSLSRASSTNAQSYIEIVLRTGVKSLDDALGTTFSSGRVVAISSEISSQRNELAKSLLINCLTTHTEGSIAVIDTTGNFDVIGLYTQILALLLTGSEKAGELSRGARYIEEKAEHVAAKALDRIKIMRVFDFVGISEAVSELSDGLKGHMEKLERNRSQQGKQAEERSMTPEEAETNLEKTSPPRRTEVADSEDEDEEEMLFDTEAPTPTATLSSLPQVPHSDQQPILKGRPHSSLKLILFSDLAHALTPLLKKDPIQANALSTTLLTTLTNLTRTYQLHTVILNPCTTPRAPSPIRRQPSNAPPALGHQSYLPIPPPPPSIFSSQPTVPALLALISRYADSHVMVSRMPRGKMDARVYYADAEGRERARRKGMEMVGVLEMIGDRWDGRVGAWGVFHEGKDGKGIQDA